eukprot:7348444-Pyramimonas_sp.AAC.1
MPSQAAQKCHRYADHEIESTADRHLAPWAASHASSLIYECAVGVDGKTVHEVQVGEAEQSNARVWGIDDTF